MKTDAGTSAPPGILRAAPAPKRKGSRSAFVRTNVPLTERVISIVIVCLIAGIGIAIWVKGGRFDPGIYSLRTDALDSTAAAVTGKASTLHPDAPPATITPAASVPLVPSVPSVPSSPASPEDSESSSAPASTAVLDKTPLEIALPGIKPMGDTEFYSSDTLYEKIDGRSPAYQAFNVQELRCRTFSIDGGGSSYVDVDEYRMDTNVNAFGIFAQERDPQGKPLDFAKDGYSGEMGYFFRQGPVYVQIIASDQNPKTMQTALAIAENRAKVLPADDSGLEGRRALPSAGLVAGSVTFVQDSAEGQDFLKNVFQGTYSFEGKQLSYFVMAATPDGCASAWKAYLDFCGKYGGKASTLPDINGAKVFQAENFGTFKVIYQRGGQIGGIVDAPDTKSALDFVTQYLQGKIQ